VRGVLHDAVRVPSHTATRQRLLDDTNRHRISGNWIEVGSCLKAGAMDLAASYP
jgi:hypothetical protein